MCHGVGNTCVLQLVALDLICPVAPALSTSCGDKLPLCALKKSDYRSGSGPVRRSALSEPEPRVRFRVSGRGKGVNWTGSPVQRLGKSVPEPDRTAP